MARPDGDRQPVHNSVSGPVGVLLAVRLLTELALVVGVAWLGALLGAGVVLSVVLAAVGVVAIGVLWGVLIAPRSARRLADPARLFVEIVLFGGTAAALTATGHAVPAIIGGVVAIGATLLCRKYAPEP